MRNTIEVLTGVFIESRNKSEWLFATNGKVYVRKSKRLHPKIKIMIDCFDIANIEIYNKGDGTFKAYIEYLDTHYPNMNILVENVHNERLLSHLRETGFVIDGINAYRIR